MVTVAAFISSMSATLIILFLTKFVGISPEAMVLAGVALGSLFAAATTLIQYFASDVKVAAIVLDLRRSGGRASWREVKLCL